MKTPRSILLVLTVFLDSGFYENASADWVLNGNPVSTAINWQSQPLMVSDGQGGGIVVWNDERTAGGSNSDVDVYAQRVGTTGEMLWAVDGIPLCIAPYQQRVRDIISDGIGGAIVAWESWTNFSADSSDVYVQRVDASGNALWGISGVALCVAARSQAGPRLARDGAGGAIVTWADSRAGAFSRDIYARRVDGNGVPQWALNGVRVGPLAGTQNRPVIASDGAGGAIIVWQDNTTTGAVYAQRLDPNGQSLWAPDGVLVSAFNGQEIEMVSDGAGGAIATWTDRRIFGNADIYVQRIDPNGGMLWTANGVPLCTAVDDQTMSQLALDGTGGIVVVWEDLRGTGGHDVYAQRVAANGTPVWAPNGAAVSTASGNQQAPQVIGDGVGGAVAAWSSRVGVQSTTEIYAQQLNAAGAPLCTPDGAPVCTAPNAQTLLSMVAGASGAIVSWQDERSGGRDIYANAFPFCAPPVPVAFTGIRAESVDDAVVVSWSTAYDEAFDGFRVYRSEVEGGFEQIGADIAPAREVTYRDEDVQAGRTYRYQVTALQRDGVEIVSPEVTVQMEIPPFTLHQSYPNPFNPRTTISFSLPREGDVRVEIFTPNGALVRRLYSGLARFGRNEVVWDGTDENGMRVSSGTYFCRLNADGHALTQKLTLIR